MLREDTKITLTPSFANVVSADTAGYLAPCNSSISEQALRDADHIAREAQRKVKRTLDDIIWSRNEGAECSELFNLLFDIFNVENALPIIAPYITPIKTLYDLREANAAVVSFGKSPEVLENCLALITHSIQTAIYVIDQSDTFEECTVAFNAIWAIAGLEGDYSPPEHPRLVVNIPDYIPKKVSTEQEQLNLLL